MDSEVSPDRVGLVWISSQEASVVRWDDDEPVVERISSGVTPRRRPAGSVRRGPARPEGGGRVHGHGTEVKHDDELRRYLAEVANRLDRLEVVEVAGRGALPERFAELLRRHASSRGDEADISSRALARRPSDAQLKARFRKIADREMPRRLVGRYRLPVKGPSTATGRPLEAAAGRRTLREPRVTERTAIEEQLEQLLAEDPG